MAEANENTDNQTPDTETVSEAATEAPKKRAPRRVRVTEPTAEIEAAQEAPSTAKTEPAKDEKAADTSVAETKSSAELKDTESKDTESKDEDAKPVAEKKAPAKRAPRKSTKAETSAEPAESSAPAAEAAGESKSPADSAAEAVAELVSTAPRRGRTSRAAKDSESKEPSAEGLESVIGELDKRENDDNGENKSRNNSRTRSRNNNQRNRQQTKNNDDSDNTEESSDDSNDSSGSSADRNNRNRQRDRKRRGGGQEDVDPEILEDDVLIPVAGILDVLDNYAFVRTTGYLPGTNDIYVSLGQVKKYNLRKGDAVIGSIRQPREGENQGRQKYNALARIDSVNGLTPEQNVNRTEFSQLTPINPSERLRLETPSGDRNNRIIDLVAPLGKGQRGLIVAPPRSGKTQLVQGIASAISENNPEVHLMMLLVDERPEEVTDVQRNVKGEIIASTFERTPEDHITIAELAIERAKRLVEMGHDVVLLLDSLTRLARAYHASAVSSARGQSDSIDAGALHAAKRFFGAARNIEDGGSLTIIATALVNQNSKLDIAVLDEFRAAANSEITLSRELADKRIFPAVDVKTSGTMREDSLIGKDELEVNHKLRRSLADLSLEDGLKSVLARLETTQNNVEFLMQVQNATTEALQTIRSNS